MTNSNEPLTVDVDLKESDLQRANFWFGLKSWSNRLMLVFMPIAGLLSLLRIDLSTIFQKPFTAILSFVLFTLPAFYLAMIWFQTKRGFGNLKPFQMKIHYAFSPEGYKVSDIKSSADIDWDAILRVAESKHSFHLFFHRSLFHTIPKRCFNSQEDIARLRALLKRALGSKASVS